MAKLKLDSQDRVILELLQKDASLSVADVAERVGISKSACWRRMQKMEQGGIIRERVTLLNQDQVNLPLTVYISVRVI
jgi:Lrp/AsnC family transcriptional regulator